MIYWCITINYRRLLSWLSQFLIRKFVVDHIAKPNIKDGIIEEWKKNIRSLSERQNVFCKLSGIITEADHGNWNYDQLVPYLDIVLESFGPETINVRF